MVKLFRCRICGDPYIGDAAPTKCPFCGAYERFIVEIKDYNATFDVELNEKDRANAEKALEVEVSNASFYFCAAKKVPEEEGKALFKCLGKVEAEHASVWRKILKLPKEELPTEECSDDYKTDLEDSHAREDRAIKFYKQAAEECENPRVKEIFEAFVEVETDHLELSEERLKSGNA